MYKILSMPHSLVPYFFYPRIYRVTDIGFVVRSILPFDLPVGLRLRRLYRGEPVLHDEAPVLPSHPRKTGP